MAKQSTEPMGSADATIARFRVRFGERVSTSAAAREQHGRDESYLGKIVRA